MMSILQLEEKKRGLQQLGTLGAGNHFLEVQRVSDIFDEATAKKWGMQKSFGSTVHGADISLKVTRMIPLAVCKD